MLEIDFATTPSAIVWPTPIIHNPREALSAASCLSERLMALMDSNTTDLEDVFVDSIDLSEWQRSRINSMWMIYTLAGEKMGELLTLLSAINAAFDERAQPTTSVGKHTDIRQRTDFAEAVAAFKAAQAVAVTPDMDEAEFEAAAYPEIAAFERLMQTRAPNIRCLHEKMGIISVWDAWGREGTADALLDDVEHLARKFEIGASVAPSADPVSQYWTAFDAYNAGEIGGDEYDGALDALDAWAPPTPIDFVRKFEAMFDEAGNPNQQRKALLIEQAVCLLGGKRAAREG